MAHQYSSSFLFTQLFSLNFSLSSSYFITPFSFWFHTSFFCSLSFSTLFYHLLFSCHSTSFFIFSLFVLFIYLIIFFVVPSLVISLVSFLLYFLCLPYLLFYPIFFFNFLFIFMVIFVYLFLHIIFYLHFFSFPHQSQLHLPVCFSPLFFVPTLIYLSTFSSYSLAQLLYFFTNSKMKLKG